MFYLIDQYVILILKTKSVWSAFQKGRYFTNEKKLTSNK